MEDKKITADEAYYKIIESICHQLSFAGRGCAKTNILTMAGIMKADVPDVYKQAFADVYFGRSEEDE